MFLERVAAEKRAEVETRKRLRPLEELRDAHSAGGRGVPRNAQGPGGRGVRRGLIEAIEAPGMSVIAEVKRKSPSAGDFGSSMTAGEIAAAYESAGAAAISVLTDEPHFGGSLEDLSEVRKVVGLPLLRKDFIIDEYQLHEARAYGADGVLLIAGMLKFGELNNLLEEARALGLDALVEVHDEVDLEKALATDARLIGINSRNLMTLEIDTSIFFELKELIYEDRLLVAESGISEPSQVKELDEAGFHGALIGSALMRSGDPKYMLSELIGA